MQRVALGLLGVMAIIFVISFALQNQYPWLAYVRAASEGGMVGGLADWFAVTALFRYPLGVKIPHTNLVSNKKDDIGEGLGSFIEENFLADDVVHEKLSEISGARMAGNWLQERRNADHVNELVSSVGLGMLTVLDDSDVRDLVEGLVRRHVVGPEWGPLLGRATESFVADNHHESLVSIAANRLEGWLIEHPQAFDRVASSRLPTWVPGVVERFVDGRLHSEAVRFVQAVTDEPDHPARLAIGRFLADLGRDLQEQPKLQAQLETFKHDMFDSPRIRALAESVWDTARSALVEMLEDPDSELRLRISTAVQDFGHRILADSTLQFKIDVWVMGAVEHLISTYRHDLANVVTETVQKWDAQEAAEKIELQVGKDLQFIRINGTVIGSLAGLAIYTFAVFVIAPLSGG